MRLKDRQTNKRRQTDGYARNERLKASYERERERERGKEKLPRKGEKE